MNIPMIRSISHAVVLCLALFTTVSCAAPILNVTDAPVKTLSGKELTSDQVTKAIVLAGMGLKWEMDVAAPGHIIGTLNLRSHQAIVDITYNTKIYSIAYKKSRGLMQVNEDGTAIGIHPNYNGWIENLDNAIRTQFIAVEQ